MEQLVFKTKKGNAATDSLKLATGFGKVHKTILRAIERMDCSPEFRQHNFVPATYSDAQGKPRPCYIISKDGFTFLALGFTGERAANFKEKYIEQFNRMEAQLVQEPVTSSVLNLQEHTQRPVQIQNSKAVNRYHKQKSGMYLMIDHNRQNCLLHTGKRPNEIKKLAKEEGMPSKWRTSAKEVLRHTQPHKACAMSLADELVQSGVSLTDAAEVTRLSEQVFSGLLRLGVTPSQLYAA